MDVNTLKMGLNSVFCYIACQERVAPTSALSIEKEIDFSFFSTYVECTNRTLNLSVVVFQCVLCSCVQGLHDDASTTQKHDTNMRPHHDKMTTSTMATTR